MRILILGASGFIGSHLTQYAVARGHEVIALCRSEQIQGFTGPVLVWALGQPIPQQALAGVDCAIHLVHDFKGQAGARLTLEATLSCAAQLHAAGIARQLFFSSYSAGVHAASIYGRTKFAIEQVLAKYPEIVIVRPGLVLGKGGLYGRIEQWSRRLPLIPLPDGGHGKVPVVTIENLSRETLKLATDDTAPAEANLFEPHLRSLRQLVLQAAKASGKRPWILPVPAVLVIAGLRLAAWLRLPLPVNADNLIGFLANQQAQHISTMQK